MPDVGVLNLQIQENSERAIGGLDELVGALTRVKNAVAGGLKLSPIANGIEKIGRVVNEHISGSTIVKIGQLADELSKLKGLENVNIRINTGTSVESVRSAVEGTRDTMNSVNSGFKEVEQRVVETAGTLGNVGNSIQQAFDPSKLPLESLGNTMDEASRQMQQYGEMAKRSFETVRDAGALDRVTSSVQEMGGAVTAIIPYNENLENSWERITARIEEAKNQAETVADVKPANGIAIYNTLEEAAQSMGITVDEARQKIEESKEAALNKLPGRATVYETLDEAAQALGITLEEARVRVHQVVEEATGTSPGTTVMDTLADGSSRAERMLELLRAKLQVLRDEIETGTTETGNILSDKTLINNQIQVEKLEEKIEHLQDTINASQGGGASIVSALGDLSQIDLMRMKYDEMEQALIRNIDAGRLNNQQIFDQMIALNKYRDRIEAAASAQDNATESTFKLSDAFNEFKHNIKNLGIVKLVSQFARLARLRAMRAMIRQIAAGFREGVESVYNYSKAIGGTFAPAMDTAVSALQMMKNSIGAAAAPLLQVMIPVLQTMVNWLITAVNYINQFVSLLRGQATWTRALPVATSAFNKQEKAAKGAGAAIKDLLADWDELNIIQSQGGGGGGGGTTGAEDFLKMFEEADRFDDSVKETVNFIKDNFGTISSIAEGIGATILAWKISKAFGNTLGFLQTLEVAAGLTLLITGVKLTTAAGYDIGKNGLNSDNLLQSIGGIMETALGGTLVGVAFAGITGGLIGLWVGTTIGLLALGISMAEGEMDKLYGDVKLTADQIQEEVDKLFVFDVTAKLNEATVDHSSLETAKRSLSTALHNAEADYATLKLKMEPESASELKESVEKVIDDANALLKMSQKVISVGFGFDVNFSDPKFVQSFSTDNISALEKDITKLGNRIGAILEDGIVDAMEGPLLEDLMSQLMNVTNAIETGRASGAFAADLERGHYDTDWATVSRESLIEYANRYTDQLAKLREAGYYQAKDTKGALGGIYAGMVQRNIDAPGTYTEEQIAQALKNYESYDMEAAINDYVNRASAEGREVFMQNMMLAFSNAISNANLDYTRYGSELNNQTDLKKWINLNMGSNLGWNVDEFQKVMDAMGVSGMDLLTEQLRERYIIAIVKALGNNAETYSRLKSELGIPINEILSVQQPAWDKWSSDTRRSFIANMSKAYGGRETLEALKNAGFDLGEILGASLKFSDTTKSSFYKTLTELYGADAIRNALINSGLDSTFYEDFLKKNVTPSGNFAHPGAMPAQYSSPAGIPGGQPNDIPSGQQVSTDINHASANIISALTQLGNDIALALQQQAKRPINVNLSTGSAFGRGVTAGLGALAKVTGND